MHAFLCWPLGENHFINVLNKFLFSSSAYSFVTMKEKLKSQLRFQGQLYRYVLDVFNSWHMFGLCGAVSSETYAMSQNLNVAVQMTSHCCTWHPVKDPKSIHNYEHILHNSESFINVGLRCFFVCAIESYLAGKKSVSVILMNFIYFKNCTNLCRFVNQIQKFFGNIEHQLYWPVQTLAHATVHIRTIFLSNLCLSSSILIVLFCFCSVIFPHWHHRTLTSWCQAMLRMSRRVST